MLKTSRVLAALAGLLGAAGIAAAALAAHGGFGDNLRTASQFAILHASVIAALCLAASPGIAIVIACATLLVGVGLFSGDLALRAVAGHALFPMAAPTGGTILIVGWLLVSVAALLALRTGPR